MVMHNPNWNIFFFSPNIFLSKQIHVKFIKRNFRCFEWTMQWQYNFCVPVCVRLCLGSWFWVVKHFPQISHLYGRSPVCVRMWIWKQEAKHDSHFLPQCYIFITVLLFILVQQNSMISLWKPGSDWHLDKLGSSCFNWFRILILCKFMKSISFIISIVMHVPE